MGISIKWVLVVTTLLSTGASLAGGLLMYWESLAALRDTVSDISEAQTGAVTNELSEYYNQMLREAESFKTFLWTMDTSNLVDRDIGLVINSKLWEYARVTSGDVAEVGIQCLYADMATDANAWDYYHVWYDLDDPTPDVDDDIYDRVYVYAHRNRTDPAPIKVDRINEDAKVVEELYNFTATEMVETVRSWPNLRAPINWPSDPATGLFHRWREPQTWVPKTTTTYYTFQAYDQLYPRPDDAANPLSKCEAVLVQTYFLHVDWKAVIRRHKEIHPLDTVVVVDSKTEWVFASTALVNGEQIVNQTCAAAVEPNGWGSAADNNCTLRCSTQKDAAAREACIFLMRERRNEEATDGGLQNTSFHVQTVGGSEFFIRRSEVRHEGANVFIIWLRPVSVVQDKVDRALTYLLIFVAIVFFVDICLALIEVLLIARPVVLLSRALERAGTMEGLEDAIDFRKMVGVPYVAEVQRITDSFDMMTEWLLAYRPFIPECVRKATGKDFSDSNHIASGNPLERRPEEEPQGHEVIEVGRSDTSCTVDTSDDRGLTQGSLTSAANSAKFAMLQGRERRLRARTATLLLAELDTSGFVSGQQLSLFVETVLDVGRQFDSVTLQVVGSGVLLSWNTHVPCPLHTQQAADCALSLASALQSAERTDVLDWWGISIVTGKVQVGIAGAAKHRASVIIGEPVGLATALATLGRRLKIRIVASGDTYDKVRSMIRGRPVDVISLPPDPEREPVGQDTVYELMDRDFGESFKTGYVEGFSFIKQQKYSEATEKFTGCVVSMPQDAQAIRLLKLALGGGDEYCRKSLGWQDLEERCKEVVLPDAVKEAIAKSEETPEESGTSLREHLGHSNDQLPLRKQIEMQQVAVPPQGQAPVRHGHLKQPLKFSTNSREWLKSKKHIGSGGYGEVALGMEGGEGTLAAFKMVRLPRMSAVSIDETDSRLMRYIDELQREVDILNGLKHDSVVSYLGSSVVNGYVVIIMEYVSGGSLDRVIKDFGELPLPVVKRYTMSILAGLEFLHKKNIVHRDLKPHNVLMTPEGQCKLADFGAAAVLTTITKDQMKVVGTPLYMSPEACAGDIRFESDIWAVGIIVIELAFGELHVTWKTELAGGYNQQAFTDKLLYKETMVPQVPASVHWEVSNFAKRCFKRKAVERPSAHALRSSPFLLA